MSRTIHVPPLHDEQKTEPKIEAKVGRQGDSGAILLVFPYEIMQSLDIEKSNILRDTFLEIQTIANKLNTILGLDEKNIFEKIFGL